MHAPPLNLLAGFALLVLSCAGCGESLPVTAGRNTENGSGNSVTNISPTGAVTPMLAPTLPGNQSVAQPPVPKNPGKRGLLALDFPAHNFGEVKQNTQLQHDFVLTNSVKEPIRIVGMKSSCSCTWSEDNDNFVGSEIAPGQKIDYPVFINTGTYQDMASGKIDIIYRYVSDELQWEGEESLSLEVSATILPDYRIEPLELTFGEILALESQTAKRTIRITPVNMESLEIVDVKSSSELFTVNILSSDKEGYEVEVTFDGSSLGNSEKVHGHLIVETNSEAVPRGLVSLSASYIAPIAVDQQYILVPSDKAVDGKNWTGE